MKGVRCWFLLAVRACMLAHKAFEVFGVDSRPQDSSNKRVCTCSGFEYYTVLQMSVIKRNLHSPQTVSKITELSSASMSKVALHNLRLKHCHCDSVYVSSLQSKPGMEWLLLQYTCASLKSPKCSVGRSYNTTHCVSRAKMCV